MNKEQIQIAIKNYQNHQKNVSSISSELSSKLKTYEKDTAAMFLSNVKTLKGNENTFFADFKEEFSCKSVKECNESLETVKTVSSKIKSNISSVMLQNVKNTNDEILNQDWISNSVCDTASNNYKSIANNFSSIESLDDGEKKRKLSTMLNIGALIVGVIAFISMIVFLVKVGNSTDGGNSAMPSAIFMLIMYGLGVLILIISAVIRVTAKKLCANKINSYKSVIDKISQVYKDFAEKAEKEVNLAISKIADEYTARIDQFSNQVQENAKIQLANEAADYDGKEFKLDENLIRMVENLGNEEKNSFFMFAMMADDEKELLSIYEKCRASQLERETAEAKQESYRRQAEAAEDAAYQQKQFQREQLRNQEEMLRSQEEMRKNQEKMRENQDREARAANSNCYSCSKYSKCNLAGKLTGSCSSYYPKY